MAHRCSASILVQLLFVSEKAALRHQCALVYMVMSLKGSPCCWGSLCCESSKSWGMGGWTWTRRSLDEHPSSPVFRS